MGDLHQDVPTRDQIELRAYELYVQRGGEDGRDLEDWLAAERELRNQHSSSTVKSGKPDSLSSNKENEKQQRPRTFAAGGNPKGF
ncbi:MAG TPA: DUF2934 domain-containing protein [Candidatus Acidoferrales bacterium]|nr:DUF2934 domain-containing protein [Candidatus Acidoferrales bacterium]